MDAKHPWGFFLKGTRLSRAISSHLLSSGKSTSQSGVFTASCHMLSAPRGFSLPWSSSSTPLILSLNKTHRKKADPSWTFQDGQPVQKWYGAPWAGETNGQEGERGLMVSCRDGVLYTSWCFGRFVIPSVKKQNSADLRFHFWESQKCS